LNDKLEWCMVTWCSVGFRVGSCIVMCDKSLWWEIKILSRVEDGLEGAEGADINLGVGDCARKR